MRRLARAFTAQNVDECSNQQLALKLNAKYFNMAIDKRHSRVCDKHHISGYPHVIALLTKCKEKGKDQESIQSSTTPDTRHHIGK